MQAKVAVLMDRVRKYPIGIQTFSEIIRSGYVYVDKTDLVRTKVKCAGGRVDMVVWMPDSIYVIELKVNDTAENALKQIYDKGYAIPYQADGRRVVKVGVSVDADTRTIKDWNVAY